MRCLPLFSLKAMIWIRHNQLIRQGLIGNGRGQEAVRIGLGQLPLSLSHHSLFSLSLSEKKGKELLTLSISPLEFDELRWDYLRGGLRQRGNLLLVLIWLEIDRGAGDLLRVRESQELLSGGAKERLDYWVGSHNCVSFSIIALRSLHTFLHENRAIMKITYRSHDITRRK